MTGIDAADVPQEEWDRFENAVKQLLNEGHPLRDFRGLLEAAADRIQVPLDEVYPA